MEWKFVLPTKYHNERSSFNFLRVFRRISETTDSSNMHKHLQFDCKFLREMALKMKCL